MSPSRFLRAGGTVLLSIGVLGITGQLGSISRASFFHPPYWINWFHLGLGAFVSGVGRRGSARLQAGTTLLAAAMGLTLGSLGLVLGSRAARHFDEPALADPTDHLAHLGVGLAALWGWCNRPKTRN